MDTNTDSDHDSDHDSDDDIVADVKRYARVLHRRASAAHPDALQRVRVLRELASASDSVLAAHVQRRHALAVAALQLGFRSWNHLLAVLGGEPPTAAEDQGDLGTLLHTGGHTNIWSAHYDEAREIRGAHGGYLLGYKRQFLIVDRFYIETLGLDPDDPDWEAIGRDWIRPVDPAARARLYRKLVHNALVKQALS